jgi:hypothetical protein
VTCPVSKRVQLFLALLHHLGDLCIWHFFIDYNSLILGLAVLIGSSVGAFYKVTVLRLLLVFAFFSLCILGVLPGVAACPLGLLDPSVSESK